MSRYTHSQFDIQNLEIYKEDPNNNRNNNQEKINYSIYKSKSSEFDIDRNRNKNRSSNSSDINDNNNPEKYLNSLKAKSETSSIIDIPDSVSVTSSNITVTSDKFKKTKKSTRGNFFSLYDIIDPSMCFQSCYNHVSYVNRVYPTGPGEEGAKTNNLSYLIFYAKSRPQKLIKVGNYLEKKAKRDIWNSRPDLVKVTLTILDSLINSCSEHMNLISKNAVNIFYEVLVSNLDLLPEVTNTFMNFSSKHDHNTLDTDESFHAKYLQVLEQFCKCCTYEDQNELKRNQTRLNGLKAIHSVVSSNTFLTSPKIDYYLIIIQPLVENILISKSGSEINISNAEEAKAHTFNKSNASSDILELENYALKSISEIMQKVTSASFEKIIKPIYSFIKDKDQWSHLHYLTKILKIAMDSIQNQYRYLLITSLFKRLNDTETNNDIKIQTNIIFVLTFVITSNERSIGLTCLELLDNLTKHLLLSLKNKNNNEKDVEVFQSAVVDCIGSLARNIYYPEQINDMLSFLINRLCFDSKYVDNNGSTFNLNSKEKKDINTISNTSIKDLSEYLNNEDIIKYRVIIFHCLRRVLENRKVSDSNTSLNQIPIGIPIELLIPTIKFLLTDSIEQKIEYFNFIACVLPYISTNNNSKKEIINQNRMFKEYHLVIFDYIKKDNLHIIDYILIYNILVVNLNQFLDEEAFITIPLIDKLQDLKNNSASIEEQIVYHTVLLKYLENVSSLIKNNALQQYVEELLNERKNNSHWVELNYDLKDIYSYKDKDFKNLGIKPDATPVTEFIDHEKINEYTNFDEELYKQYPELKEKGKDISFSEFLETVTGNHNVKKTNSVALLENKHNKLANISIPQLESKIPDYVNVDELKNALDINVKNDHKLEDFTMEGYSSNNVLSNEISNLLNEISMVTPQNNNNNNNESNKNKKLEDNALESPTKSVNTQSTGNATMVNTSPSKSSFSFPNDKTKLNKDILNESDNNLSSPSELIQQQSIAYPKMEMNMNNLMVPGSDTDNRTQSIYVKEPSLR